LIAILIAGWVFIQRSPARALQQSLTTCCGREGSRPFHAPPRQDLTRDLGRPLAPSSRRQPFVASPLRAKDNRNGCVVRGSPYTKGGSFASRGGSGASPCDPRSSKLDQNCITVQSKMFDVNLPVARDQPRPGWQRRPGLESASPGACFRSALVLPHRSAVPLLLPLISLGGSVHVSTYAGSRRGEPVGPAKINSKLYFPSILDERSSTNRPCLKTPIGSPKAIHN
jgi:hypothetical protein